jgi:hypothetical protein
MSDLDPGRVPDREPPRWWESQWYQISPRSFRHYELLFEPDRLLLVFAGESYKSFLLRQDGRERRATEIGREHATRSRSVVLADEHNRSVSLSGAPAIRIKEGSWIRKPKLSVETTEDHLKFYHFSRTYDASDFAEWASETYGESAVRYS